MSEIGITDTKALNQLLLDKLTSGNETHVKEAARAVDEYTRLRVREDGFARKILPPMPLSNDDLDKQVDTDKNVKVVDREPDSPGAISIGYGGLPINRYIKGQRYRVMFARIVTPRFTKDVGELRSYDMDIRQVLSDNAIKDMLAEEDGGFLAACNTLLGVAGSTVAETGTIQHRNMGAGITRDSLNEALKIMPSTPRSLEPSTVLVNSIFIKDVQKFGRDEVGGDLSEEIFRNGFAERVILGVRWIVTIKRDLVGDTTMYQFAEPKYLGKFYTLEDTTMYIDRKAYFIEFFAYEELGAAIGNIGAVARANFS